MSVLYELFLDCMDLELVIVFVVVVFGNWGCWGDEDVYGIFNFIDEVKCFEVVVLVRCGVIFLLVQFFDGDGFQNGWWCCMNLIYIMFDIGVDVVFGNQGFLYGFGGVDDVVFMLLQVLIQWDGFGYIFDYGKIWNGCLFVDVVISEGDKCMGIEMVCDCFVLCGVLFDVGVVFGIDGELFDGFVIIVQYFDDMIVVQGELVQVG